MSLDDAETNIPKRLAAIAKLPKAQLTPDKVKAVKDVTDFMKKVKTFQQSRDAMNKKIKDAKKLGDEVDKWKSEFSKFINEATKLTQDLGKIKPDTPSRDFFMIANYTSGVGTTTLDPYP